VITAREVVTRRGLDEFPTRAHHGAIGQHHLQAEDVVAGHPVADGAHAAGVGGDVAAEGCTGLTRRHRVDEIQRRQGAVQLLKGDARLDHGHLVLPVDLFDGPHPVEGDHDPVGHGLAATGEPGATAPDDHGESELAGRAQNVGDLFGGRG
jgi:hypothetical protein